MLAIVIFSKILYSVVLVVCVFVAAETFAFRKTGGFKDGARLVTVFLACFCGVLVSIVYFFADRTLSGSYLVHLSFAMTPLFLHRMAGEGWWRLMLPLLVTGIVSVGSALSFCAAVSWNVDGWVPPLMLVMLVISIIICGWRLMDGEGKFDAVAAGGAWSMALADILYYSVLNLLACVGLAVGQGSSWSVAGVASMGVLLLIGLVFAMWHRLRDSRSFYILHSREESFLGNIYRSMRSLYVNNEEFGLSGENLFIRLKEYFDEKLPYLDPNLTMTDVAKSLITNKVYLSRAIKDFTGQNFCQFVNLYRVKYAIRLYNCNSAYKIPDLAIKSGFHSPRSFTMAFRLYMNVTPSRWLKQNRSDSVVKVLRN